MSLGKWLLWPLTLPYGVVVRLRALAFQSHFFQEARLDATVVSIGNLTVGGTGKTPMVLWLADRLLAEGKRVGILTRGYRGEPSRGRSASGSGGADSTSDEAQLSKARFSNRVAFGIGPDRVANGRELVRQGTEWLVLDDGFQHQQVARDVNIVLIDALNPFGGGHLLPAGRLREPESALARADIIIITRSRFAPAVEATIRRHSKAPIFYAQTQLNSIQEISEGQSPRAVSADQLPRLLAFCGIGNPGAFLADLRGWDLPIVGQRFFPDHHRYTQEDDDEIERLAREAGAAGVICTEKDVYNLRGIYYRLNTYYCSISMHVDREEEFWRAVVSVADSRRGLARAKLRAGK